MSMDVTLPDGTVVKGIPDGTTKADLAKKLTSNGMKVPQEWLAPAAPTTPKQRAQNFVGGLNLPNAEKDPGMRAFEQGAFPEAGGPGAALKAAGKYVPQSIKQPVVAGMDWLDTALGRAKNLVKGPTAEQKATDIIRKTASDLPSAKKAIAAAAAPGAKQLVKGSRGTTAAATSDEGLLGLEKTVRNLPGASERAGREIAGPNNVARSNVVSSMAGDADKLVKLKGAREAAAQQLYAKADKAQVNVDQQFKDLMQRPSMVKALAKAKALAKEANDPLGPNDLFKSANGKTVPGKAASKLVDVNGQPLSAGTPPSKNLQISGKGLHYMKMALDSLLEGEGANSLGKTDKEFMNKTRDAFLKWTEDRVPEYKQARETFRDMSKPINRMELMQKIQARATSNATDASGNKIITRNGYQNAVKQYRKDLERTMTPAQLKHIDQISKDLDNAEKVNSPQIRPAGSETIRNANAQESPATLLGRLTGGHGATAALTQLVAKAPGFAWLRNVPPEQVREILVDAMLDPKVANQLLNKSPANLNRLSETLKGIAAEIGSTGVPAAQMGAAMSQPPPGQQQ